MWHPWYLYEGWQEDGATYYNATEGTPEYEHYYSTLSAFYRNSFEVPCLAGFAILMIFTFVVLVATLRNLLLHAASRSSLASTNPFLHGIQKHITEAPLFRTKHAKIYKFKTDLLSIQAPLRGESMILLGLFLANILPIVAFYTPYTSNNLYWPNEKWLEIGRYISDRSGILATAQFPPLILLAGRSNPVITLTGASYATSMLYHRWFARFVFLQVLVHGIGYSVISVVGGGSVEYKALFADVYLRMGVVATVFMGFMIFFSMRWFRAKAYEWFVLTHILFAVIVVIGTFYHIELLNEDGSYADFINCIYASIFFWCLDKTIRIGRILYLNGLYNKVSNGRSTFCGTSHGTVAILSSSQDLISMTITLQGRGVTRWIKDAGRLRAGINVQIWIPRVQPLSSHPFTVARLESNEEGKLEMLLYAKVHKGITQRLFRRAKGNGGQCDLNMMVEGFYGEQIKVHAARKQVLIAGGIGVTHCLPYLCEAMKRGTESSMIWLIRDPTIIACAVEMLRDVSPNQQIQSSNDSGVDVKDEEEEAGSMQQQTLSIYITRPFTCGDTPSEDKTQHKEQSSPSFEDSAVATLDKQQNGENTITTSETFSPTDLFEAIKVVSASLNVSIHPLQHRPELESVVQELSHSSIQGKPTELICCGPADLLDCSRAISRKMDYSFHEEGFSW